MTCELLQEDYVLTIEEICETCQLSRVKIQSYIEEGIVEVSGSEASQWRFSEIMIVQIKKATRLENDLGLNPAGVALALDLMSQIDDLKNQLKRQQS